MSPALSEKQRKAMAIAEHEPDKLYARNKGMLKMTHDQLHDFAVKPISRKSRHGSGRFHVKHLLKGFKRV